MTNSILPNNATPAELALEAAVARVQCVEVDVIGTMQSPQNIPDAALPWLAWAFSVDNWDETWSDAQKRATVAASYMIHRKKGTVGAIRSALDALGIGLVLTEWFQMTPPGAPYTFSVSVTSGDTDVSQSQLQQAMAVIQTTKNLRSQLLSLDVSTVSDGTVYHGGACGIGNTITIGSA